MAVPCVPCAMRRHLQTILVWQQDPLVMAGQVLTDNSRALILNCVHNVVSTRRHLQAQRKALSSASSPPPRSSPLPLLRCMGPSQRCFQSRAHRMSVKPAILDKAVSVECEAYQRCVRGCCSKAVLGATATHRRRRDRPLAWMSALRAFRPRESRAGAQLVWQACREFL